MGIKQFLGKKSKVLDTKTPISLEQAKKYQKDKDYKDYFFEPVIEDGVMKCFPRLEKKPMKAEKQEEIEVQKLVRKTETKRNSAFFREITGNGAYQGMGRKVTESRMDRGQPKKYGDWQKAKRYNSEQFMR